MSNDRVSYCVKSLFLCWGLVSCTRRLPSIAPAAAPTADLVLNCVPDRNELAMVPTAAPSAATPVPSHEEVHRAFSGHM